MEAQINKDSDNSNKPPSTDDPFRKQPKNLREKSGGKQGGQNGHHGSTTRVSNPDSIVRHNVEFCCSCNHDLKRESINKEKKRQVFDIPEVRISAAEHCAEIKICPHCGTRNEGKFPTGVENHTQYGPNISSLVVSLKMVGFMSFERIGEFVSERFGVQMSEATMVGMIENLKTRLEPFENWVKPKIIDVVNHADENETDDIDETVLIPVPVHPVSKLIAGRKKVNIKKFCRLDIFAPPENFQIKIT